jgi:predicted RNase H-like nuclease (RuvC/YqgF family)
MSSESQPISAERFAFAIKDLPAENLYAKAQELENSIAHLERSNKTLQEYIDSIRSDTSLSESTRQEGDKDCSDAIQENQVVIERQKERIDLLKREVERRGAKWHEGDTNGTVNGSSGEVATNGSTAETERNAGGRLTDEELRRQMMDRLGNDEDGDEEGGMHL